MSRDYIVKTKLCQHYIFIHGKYLIQKTLRSNILAMRFGKNVKRLRKRCGISQKELARRLGHKDAANSNVSTLERRGTHVPEPATIRRYAIALECEPWELLVGVPTDYDRLRTPLPLSDVELDVLLVGLAYLKPSQRARVLDQIHVFLVANGPALRDELPAQELLQLSAHGEKAARTHPGERKKATTTAAM